jgi:hypothetical protein
MSHYDIKWNPASGNFTQANATQKGDVEISDPGPVDYTEGGWYGGYDDAGSYVVVSDTNNTSLAGRPTADATGTASTNFPTFWKVNKSDNAILNLINKLPGSPGNFETAADAKTWINSAPTYGLVTGNDSGLTMLVYGDINGSLNYWAISETGTVGPVDLGSNFQQYNLNTYVAGNGYMIYCYNTDFGAFISNNGTLLDSRAYSGNTDYDNADSNWLYIKDNNNKIFAYSNGAQFNVVDWSSLDNYYIDWNYDAATQNGGMIMYANSGSSASYYLLNTTSTGYGTQLVTWDNSLYAMEEFVYGYGDTIHLLKRDRNDNYRVLEYKIVNNSGTILQTIDLSAENIYSWDFNFFGHGKSNVMFYTWNDSSQDYLIYFYKDSTDTLISARHPRGSEYFHWDQWYNGYYNEYPENRNSENFLIAMYEDDYNWDCSGGCGYVSSYIDLIPYFDGDTTPRLIVLQDSGVQDKKLVSWPVGRGGSNFLIRVTEDFGNTDIKRSVSISASGLTYNDTVDLGNNWDYWEGGDRILFVNYDTGLITVLSTNGTTLDTLDCSEGGIDIWARKNTFIVRTSSKVRYMNESSTTFQTADMFDGSVAYPNDAEAYPAGELTPGNFLLIDVASHTIQIITDNSYTSFTTPYDFNEAGQYGYGLSKSTFYVMYRDNSGVYNFNLYDFSASLLISNGLSWSDLYDYGITQNKVWYRGYTGSNYAYGMMSSSATNVVEAPTDAWYILSDYPQHDDYC